MLFFFFFFQAEDGIRDLVRSRGLGDVYKRQRQGGDEFTVLLPDINNTEDVIMIAQKMLAELKQPFSVAEQDYIATVSIGIAIYPEDGETSEDLIRNADLAMYQTKSQGKNGYLEFTSAMNTTNGERLSLENDLRLALKKGCLLYTSPSPRDRTRSRMPSSA